MPHMPRSIVTTGDDMRDAASGPTSFERLRLTRRFARGAVFGRASVIDGTDDQLVANR